MTRGYRDYIVCRMAHNFSRETFPSKIYEPMFTADSLSEYNFTGTISSEDVRQERELRWAVLPAYLLVVAAVVGNTLVCLAVRRERRLRNTFNFFLVSLAISDLLCATLIMPVTITKAFIGESLKLFHSLTWAGRRQTST